MTLVETVHKYCNVVLFSKFRLSYYPHLLEKFNKLITGVFGEKASHTILADFEPLQKDSNPSYYVHICEKVE